MTTHYLDQDYYNELPDDWRDWPPGGARFAVLARRINPRLTFADLRPLADRLFASPVDTPKTWPSTRVDPESLVVVEGGMVVYLVQAWVDRVDWLTSLTDFDLGLMPELEKIGRVLSSLVRYLPGACWWDKTTGDDVDSGEGGKK